MEMVLGENVQRTDNRLRNLDLTHLTERLWAFLTIKKLLDERLALIDGGSESARSELESKILELSLQVSLIM